MKEIGDKLKQTRENMGISLEEVSEDLKLDVKQLTDIEEGNKEAFKDVFVLKNFIRDYSKYLGLDYDEMVEEFNEYLFDYTSKISIEDIKKSNKKEKKEVNKIVSPYTIERKAQKSIPPYLIIILVVLLVIIIVSTVFLLAGDKNKEDKNVISMGECYYEFA